MNNKVFIRAFLSAYFNYSKFFKSQTLVITKQKQKVLKILTNLNLNGTRLKLLSKFNLELVFPNTQSV